jgi:hypothetical protein
MSTDPTKTESSLEEQLVAYLDGELDAESVRRIEERLGSEPEVREALNRLEQTWDVLDELGSTPVGDGFTRTTLEMVAVAAQEDVEHAKVEVPLRRRRRRWLLGAGILATVAAGFFTVYSVLPNPARQLLQDLPVLENLDEYRQIDDIKFLRLMKEKGLFPPTKLSRKEPPRLEHETPAEMAERVASMPQSDKSELLQKKEDFGMLGRTEQEKLRALQKEIQKDKASAELFRIMRDYYDWWKTLPPYFRNELSSLVASPQARVERVERMKQDEIKFNPSIVLTEQDVASLKEWLDRYVKKFEARHRESISESERKKWDALPDPQRRRELMRFLFWQRGQGGGNKTLQLPEDLAVLRDNLSPEARQHLEGKSPEDQWKKILSWLPAIARQQFPARMGRRPGFLVDENEIAKFFESLPAEEQMQLLNLQPEDMQHELQQRWYLSRMKPMESFLGRPEGPPPGGPHGPRNPPEQKPPKGPE